MTGTDREWTRLSEYRYMYLRWAIESTVDACRGKIKSMTLQNVGDAFSALQRGHQATLNSANRPPPRPSPPRHTDRFYRKLICGNSFRLRAVFSEGTMDFLNYSLLPNYGNSIMTVWPAPRVAFHRGYASTLSGYESTSYKYHDISYCYTIPCSSVCAQPI